MEHLVTTTFYETGRDACPAFGMIEPRNRVVVGGEERERERERRKEEEGPRGSFRAEARRQKTRIRVGRGESAGFFEDVARIIYRGLMKLERDK